MKLMINASNLYVGGGVQVAVSVIEELTKIKTDFIAAVSPVVILQLSDESKEKCVLIDSSPSKIFNFKVRKQLDFLVASNNITTVFTIFGPSYWSPKKVLHAVGFALPWLIYDTSKITPKLSLSARVKVRLLKYIQPYFYKKNADIIFTETEDVKNRVIKLLKISECNVHTVSNTLNSLFKDLSAYDNNVIKKLPVKKNDEKWLLTITHNYPHKNLGVIIKLVEYLPENFKFILTVPSSFINVIPDHLKNRIVTVDTVSVSQCPVLYQLCDALFLPTLLECFSASYLEAMFMGRLILTSDLSFAHTVCHNAAIYFDPYNENDIADKIKTAFSSEKLVLGKIEAGATQFQKFPSARERAVNYLTCLSKHA